MAAPEVVNFYQNIPASPGSAATGSTTGIQCGFGVTGSFVPQSSGAALITITGTLANNTASQGAFAGISIGLGTAPTLGATPMAGVAVGIQARITNNASTAAVPFPFTMQVIVTGLTLGLGYWIDMQIGVVGTAGTATPAGITIAALEL